MRGNARMTSGPGAAEPAKDAKAVAKISFFCYSLL